MAEMFNCLMASLVDADGKKLIFQSLLLQWCLGLITGIELESTFFIRIFQKLAICFKAGKNKEQVC